jgi:hypothetical protein
VVRVDKLKLLMGRPILANKENNIVVKQPRISDVVDLGEDTYNKMLLPFVITTESIFGGLENEEELMQQYHIFELFFIELSDGNSLLDNVFGENAVDTLVSSLGYFLQTDNIKVLKHRKKLVVDDNYLIDNAEFDNIRTIVQSVVGRKDLEIEKPPKNMTPRQKDIWEKLQKGRRRRAEKDAVYLQDMINYTAFGGQSYIPLDHIDKMTYYQFQNAYKSVMGKDAFNVGMSYKLSQKFEVKDDIKHWSDSLKIGK